jgi:hypothetical protein
MWKPYSTPNPKPWRYGLEMPVWRLDSVNRVVRLEGTCPKGGGCGCGAVARIVEEMVGEGKM